MFTTRPPRFFSKPTRLLRHDLRPQHNSQHFLATTNLREAASRHGKLSGIFEIKVPRGIGRSNCIVWIICRHTQVVFSCFVLDIIPYAYHPSLCLHPSRVVSSSSTSSVQSVLVTANQPLSSSAAAKGVELLAQPSRGGSATYLLEQLTLDEHRYVE